MVFKLGKRIQVGQKIKTNFGWRKIKEVTEKGAIVQEGCIQFGETIYGWQSS